jgi:hypothetical protein
VAARLKIEITRKAKTVTDIALANSGYESQEAEIVVPSAVARKLGIRGRGSRERFIVAGKKEVAFEAHGDIAVRVIVGDRLTSAVVAKVFVSRSEDRIIMNDVLCGALGLVLLDFGLGKWRFKDDPADMERRSEFLP